MKQIKMLHWEIRLHMDIDLNMLRMNDFLQGLLLI